MTSSPILTGARGHDAVDLATLETTLLRLNQLLADFPEIAEFDLNPYFAAATADGCGAADARITLTP